MQNLADNEAKKGGRSRKPQANPHDFSQPQEPTLGEEIIKSMDRITAWYVGVRKHESLARSTYEYENYGKKQKGQRSFNPLLEWTSAEIWLYIFSNKIYINNAYKKGNSRAGCLLCPMAGGSSDYIRRCNYPDEIDGFIDIIKRKNNWDNYSKAELHSYVS